MRSVYEEYVGGVVEVVYAHAHVRRVSNDAAVKSDIGHGKMGKSCGLWSHLNGKRMGRRQGL